MWKLKTLLATLLLFQSLFLVAQSSRFEDDPALHKAIRSNNISEVKKLINSGTDVNTENDWRISAVEVAIQSNHIEIVKYLLSQGASDKSGMSSAAAHNNLEMVKLLISNGFSHGYSVIYACEENNFEMLKALVTDGASVNISQKRKSGLFSKYYVSPIEFAVSNNNKPMVIYLMDHGVSIDDAVSECFSSKKTEILKEIATKYHNYNSLLIGAFESNNIELIDFLLLEGADINHKDEKGNSVLSYAAENGNIQNLKMCIEKYKQNINLQNNEGQTPLMLACNNKHIDAVNYLIGKGALLEIRDNNGQTALFYSVSDNTGQLFNSLIQSNANAIAKDNSKSSVLMEATKKENHKIIEYYLLRNLIVHDKDNKSNSAFQYLIANNNHLSPIVLSFLDKGADINAKSTDNGKSLMYYAINSNSLSKIKELITLGASIQATNDKGFRPETDNAEVILYLIENNVDINMLDSRNQTFLCEAIDENNLELAHTLISKGANPNISCKYNETPLMLAIDKQNLTMVQLLVDNKADINAEDRSNRNCTELAIREGNQSIIEYLKSKGGMTKEERNQLYKKTIEIESELKLALNQQNTAKIIELLSKSEKLPIQEKLILQCAQYGIRANSTRIIDLLLINLAFDIETPMNSINQSPLILATILGFPEMVQHLILQGADIHKKDDNDKNAYAYAKGKSLKTLLKEGK